MLARLLVAVDFHIRKSVGDIVSSIADLVTEVPFVREAEALVDE